MPVMEVRVGPKECPSPHSFGNKLGRGLWGIVWLLLFRPTPRLLHSWRRFLLRLFGARIGRGVKVFSSVRVWAPWLLTMEEYSTLSAGVDCYCAAPITIGAHATVSQDAFLCTATHDVCDPHMRLLTAPITVADQAWVCARAFVGPGVTVAQGAVVGAMAVVTKDVPAWTIVAGNPAREIRKRELRPSSEAVQ
ncbi:MAG: colanic acid biosynthesis acetyltransferase WcaF [Thermoguttaceae bacterium]